MEIIILSIVFFIMTLGAIIACFIASTKVKKVKKDTEKIAELDKQFKDLLKQYENVSKNYINVNTALANLEMQKNEVECFVRGKREQLKLLEESCTVQREQLAQTFGNYQDGAEMAFHAWCDVLNNQYLEKEKEYDENIHLLEQAYDEKQNELQTIYLNTSKEVQEYIQSIKADLERIEKTKAAIMEAQRKELEIKQKLSFYCLSITEAEVADIRVLERIKPELKAPRILSMLIWSTYYQKPMTTLCNNVLGTNTVCGIYKITNQINDCCYIGQAVDVAKRWKDHVKCGLGIDTPANNKLYKAMKEDGVTNFSFELLETCSRAELDEKEKYYISLYQSKDYGYNSSAGNGK